MLQNLKFCDTVLLILILGCGLYSNICHYSVTFWRTNKITSNI